MNNRNTKQKQLIVDILMRDKTHPTISDIYQKVLKQDSSIGQATVYRNINKLVKKGKIIRITTPNDVDHYDGNISEHFHLFCKKCDRIIDIFDVSLVKQIEKSETNKNIKIDNYHLFFEGICQDCLMKE